MDTLKRSKDTGRLRESKYKRARELMRGMMPQAAMVERTTIMNLRSFANYQRLRNSPHAQKEIRHAAKLMLKTVDDACIAPIAIAALKQKGWLIDQPNHDWELL